MLVSVGAGFGVTVDAVAPALRAGAPGVKFCTPTLLLSILLAVGATGATVALDATTLTLSDVAAFCEGSAGVSHPAINSRPKPTALQRAAWHIIDLFMCDLRRHRLRRSGEGSLLQTGFYRSRRIALIAATH